MNSATTTKPKKTVKSAVRNAFAAVAILASTGLGGCCPPCVQTRQTTTLKPFEECLSQDAQRAAQAEKFIAQSKPAIGAAYNRALKRDPTLQGKVEVKMTIGKDGTVSAISIEGRGVNDELREKYSKILDGFRGTPGSCETNVSFLIINVCDNCSAPVASLK